MINNASKSHYIRVLVNQSQLFHHDRKKSKSFFYKRYPKSSSYSTNSSSDSDATTTTTTTTTATNFSSVTKERLKILLAIDSFGIETMLLTSEGKHVVLNKYDLKQITERIKMLQMSIPYAKENLIALIVENPTLLAYESKDIIRASRYIPELCEERVTAELLCTRCPAAFSHVLKRVLDEVPYKKFELSLREWLESVDGKNWAHCFTQRPIVCSEWSYLNQMKQFDRKSLQPWIREEKDRVYKYSGKSVRVKNSSDDDDDDD